MKGTFILSIDVELAWGSVGAANPKSSLPAVGGIRQIVDPLLKIIGNYRIPVSWAIVGHVFLDRCEHKDRPHPDMPRPHYTWFKGDWYKYDPCSDVDTNPLWYGSDIVAKIMHFTRESPAEQDIGCHSFSHQIFGDPGCSEEVAKAEIDKCLKIMADRGIHPRTFVFPIGSVGHLNVLREKGFTAYRGTLVERVERYASLERSAQNVLRRNVALADEFMSYYLLASPPVVFPEETLPGLWSIPGSMGFGKKPGVPNHLVVMKAKRGIRRAIKEEKCFQMFTHLHNFGGAPSLLKDFESILKLADEEREKGKLQIMNMQQLVAPLK